MLRRTTARSLQRFRGGLEPFQRKLCYSQTSNLVGGSMSRGLTAQSRFCFPKTLQSHPIIRSSYSTTSPGTGDEPERSPNVDDKEALARLETFAANIKTVPPLPNAESRLLIGYAFIYEITRYLARHGDDSEAYLSVFMNSEAPDNSDLRRARKSVFLLTESVVTFLSSVSLSSPLREEHSGIFDLLGALQPLCMMYDVDSDTRAWREFWNRAQPVILELGVQLDQAGFGAD
ncbi:hypothetical protein DFH09DRAFT_1147078 [Mycena vulgaris]|nr:hypothetical protein DFH09DRAFT_1147078 [Mycena vulgaris]